jgi:hypothetical protein
VTSCALLSFTNSGQIALIIRRSWHVHFVCSFVSMVVRGKPRMYLSLAGFLYRPLWTFQLWPPDAPAPTDAFRTLAAEVGTYGRGMRTGNLAYGMYILLPVRDAVSDMPFNVRCSPSVHVFLYEILRLLCSAGLFQGSGI